MAMPLEERVPRLREPIRALGPTLVLLAHGLLTVAVALNNGFYHPVALVGVVAAWIVLMFTCLRPTRGDAANRVPAPRVIALWLAALCLATLINPPLLYAEVDWFEPAFDLWNQLLFVAALTLFALNPRALGTGRFWGWTALGIVGVGVVFRLLVLQASPSPTIDVFTVLEDGAAAFLRGVNPYEATMRDPYAGGAQRYGYTLASYVYTPANLLPYTLAFAVVGDVRIISVLSDLVTSLAMAWVAWRRLPHLWHSPAALVTAAPLLHSKGAFVTEQAWTEPLLVAVLALWWVASAFGRERLAATAFGYFLALKMYLVFWVLIFVGYAFGRRRLILIAIPPAVVALTALPFLLWNPQAFIHHVITWQLEASLFLRVDSLSLLVPLFQMSRVVLNATVAFGFVFGITVLFLFRWWRRGPAISWREDLVLIGATTTLALFMLGRHAFANYYYFLTSVLPLVVIGAGLERAASASSTFHSPSDRGEGEESGGEELPEATLPTA